MPENKTVAQPAMPTNPPEKTAEQLQQLIRPEAQSQAAQPGKTYKDTRGIVRTDH